MLAGLKNGMRDASHQCGGFSAGVLSPTSDATSRRRKSSRRRSECGVEGDSSVSSVGKNKRAGSYGSFATAHDVLVRRLLLQWARTKRPVSH